jgi:hypothetical protein
VGNERGDVSTRRNIHDILATLDFRCFCIDVILLVLPYYCGFHFPYINLLPYNYCFMIYNSNPNFNSWYYFCNGESIFKIMFYILCTLLKNITCDTVNVTIIFMYEIDSKFLSRIVSFKNMVVKFRCIHVCSYAGQNAVPCLCPNHELSMQPVR